MSYKSKIYVNTSFDSIEVYSQGCGDCAIKKHLY